MKAKSLLLLLSIPFLLGGCSLTNTQITTNPILDIDDTSGNKPSGNNSNTSNNDSNDSNQNTSSNTSISKDVSEFNFSNTEKVTSFELNAQITATCGVGTNINKNAPTFYASDNSLRFYVGNTLTLVNSRGKITKVEFLYASDNSENIFDADEGKMSNDGKTWNGSESGIAFSTMGSKGKILLFSIKVSFTSSNAIGDSENNKNNEENENSGQNTGVNDQPGNGNTSSNQTVAWTGIQYDIAYSLFKGNLPCLKNFNGYKVGNIGGSTKMYFNPYIKGYSKDSQNYYDNALKDMGYNRVDIATDEEGTEWYYYEKGLYNVQTAHYKGTDNEYYFDVYAYNDYEAPFKLNYEPTVKLTTEVYPIKSGYKQFTKTINGITFACSYCTENNSFIQLGKKSMMEITSSTALSKMDITFNLDKSCALVYAGTSSSNAKVIYNDGNHFELPSGTKYTKIQALDSIVQIDSITVK